MFKKIALAAALTATASFATWNYFPVLENHKGQAKVGFTYGLPADKVSTGDNALTSASPRTAKVMTLSVEKTVCSESVIWKKKCPGSLTWSVMVSMSASQPSGSEPKQEVFITVMSIVNPIMAR